MGKNGFVFFNYFLFYVIDNSGVFFIMFYYFVDIFRQFYLLQNQVRVINRVLVLGILTFFIFDIKIRDLFIFGNVIVI